MSKVKENDSLLKELDEMIERHVSDMQYTIYSFISDMEDANVPAEQILHSVKKLLKEKK